MNKDTDLALAASIFEPIKPYFTYQKELRTVAPVISYLCALFGIQKGLDLFKEVKPKLTPSLQGVIQAKLV
jgi:hypothetical protein